MPRTTFMAQPPTFSLSAMRRILTPPVTPPVTPSSPPAAHVVADTLRTFLRQNAPALSSSPSSSYSSSAPSSPPAASSERQWTYRKPRPHTPSPEDEHLDHVDDSCGRTLVASDLSDINDASDAEQDTEQEHSLCHSFHTLQTARSAPIAIPSRAGMHADTTHVSRARTEGHGNDRKEEAWIRLMHGGRDQDCSPNGVVPGRPVRRSSCDWRHLMYFDEDVFY